MNSIRHLAVRPDGTVAAAMQWEGDLAKAPPLLMTHQRGTAPKFHAFGEAAHRRMQGYAGSVAFAGQGNMVAISSPRGGLVQVFDTLSGAPLTQIESRDVCGLAQSADGIFVSTGTGQLWHLSDSLQMSELSTQPLAWDNHVVPIRLQASQPLVSPNGT